MYEQATILVTGGAGFLGSRIVRRLAETARQIFVLDDLYTGRRDAVLDAANVTFVHGSVTDGTLVADLMKHVQYVFHFAARNLQVSIAQPESDFIVNAGGTANILLSAIHNKEHIKRIVIASTSSVYGNAQIIPTNEHYYDVSTPYAATKMTAELLAQAYDKTYNVPTTCLRFSNVYGPGQVPTNPYCGVVSKFFEALRDGNPIIIYGDGTQTRDFTYVDDAIEAAVLLGQSDATRGEVFNVGTGIETNINQLAEAIARIAGARTPVITHAPKRDIDTVSRRAVDTSRLRALTHWQFSYPLMQGLNATWQWFVDGTKL